MERVEKHLLDFCIEALVGVFAKLKETPGEELIRPSSSGKEDSLCLDVLPENMLRLELLTEYDRHIVLVTEEKGKFNYEEISEAEFVIFSDPTDRSKQLKKFIQEGISREIISLDSTLSELLAADEAVSLWEEIGGAPAQLSGACCSLTVVKRGEILFSLVINYITGEIIVACKDHIAIQQINEGLSASTLPPIVEWKAINFKEPKHGKSYVTYLGKSYSQYLADAKLLNPTYTSVQIEPGGPLRVLYLSDLNPNPNGFILSNGEKIGEWIGWLAFCRYSSELVAYSVFPGTSFARDDILMTPSPPYSILEIGSMSLRLNYEKLKYFDNPSRYREMILVTHKRNTLIRATIEGSKSRELTMH
jgi:hypothetical protein